MEVEELRTELEELLGDQFPGAMPRIEVAAPSRKVGGFLIWDDFEGHSQIERQRNVWQVLRGHLTPDDQGKITAILTVTPAEVDALAEDNE